MTVAAFLRRLADRIDPDGAWTPSPYSFTVEAYKGLHLRPDGRGAALWYRPADMPLAHDQADRAHDVLDVSTGTYRTVGGRDVGEETRVILVHRHDDGPPEITLRRSTP